MTDSLRHTRTVELGHAAFGKGWSPTIEALANGRIEVIGNHTDYNGGPVVAAAIDRGITVLAAPTTSGRIQAVFPDVSGEPQESISVDALLGWRTASTTGPGDYLRAVVASALEAGLTVRRSLDLVVHGDIPVGGALSSSAALCVGLANTLIERPPGKPELVLLAQDAEHRVGAPVGTMDQSASVFGGIILFGGSPHHVTSMTVDLAEHRFVVLGSGVQHRVANSSYGQRVEECRQAVERLRSCLGPRVEVLADVSIDDLEAATVAGAFVDAPTLYLRARHIVTEVARVRAGLSALEDGEWEEFGALMNASGRSSATDYDISHPVVEELVARANEIEGVLGARMMGGGEGGNALALVEDSAIPSLESHLGDTFYEPRGLDRERLVFVCRIGEAASVAVVDRE